LPKMSWSRLQNLPVAERWKTTAEALREARRRGEGFFAADGTILVPVQELYAQVFTGVVKPNQAQSLTRYLKENGVIASDGGRGRAGATLWLVDSDVAAKLRDEEKATQTGEDTLQVTVSSPLPEQLAETPNVPKDEQKPETDSLVRAYQGTQAVMVKNRQTLTDIEAALAIRELLAQKGLSLSDLDRIVKLLKSHQV
jgi:hypothetical protein